MGYARKVFDTWNFLIRGYYTTLTANLHWIDDRLTLAFSPMIRGLADHGQAEGGEIRWIS
jgi:hypothetical protein